MNTKSQTEIVAAVMGILGAAIAWFISGRMETTLVYRIITTVVTGIICYIIAWVIGEA